MTRLIKDGYEVCENQIRYLFEKYEQGQSGQIANFNCLEHNQIWLYFVMVVIIRE